MKIRFRDKETNDSWIEEYPSLESITKEMKEGCEIIISFICSCCKKEIETLDSSEEIMGICKNCQKKMDKHIES